MDDIPFIDDDGRYRMAVIHLEGQARQVLAQIDVMLAGCGTGRCPNRTLTDAKQALSDYPDDVEVTAAVKG